MTDAASVPHLRNEAKRDSTMRVRPPSVPPDRRRGHVIKSPRSSGPRRLYILAFSVLGWIGPAHAELVPGLPVYSMDGSVDTSRTMAGFQAEVWQISTPLPARVAGLVVDDQGRVWIAWESDVRRQDADVFLGKLDAAGGVEFVHPVAPRGLAPGWWRYAMAAGPEGPWCAIVTTNDRRGTERLHVFPCDDIEAGWIQDRTSRRSGTWGLAFIGGEPVVFEDAGGGLQAYWVRSGFAEEVYLEFASYVPMSCCGSIRATWAGPTLAVLWGGSLSFPHSRNYGESNDFLSIHRDGSWKTELVTKTRYQDPFFPEDLGLHEDVALHPEQVQVHSFAEAMNIGSDGASRVYIPFVQDAAPQPDPARANNGRVPFYIQARPQVRAYEAATLDTVEEWTLGYKERRERVWHTTHAAAVTAGHERVGFAITRGGNLDLWVLTGGSWYGPYRITSGISVSYPTLAASYPASPDIVVDLKGHYWLAWSQDGTVHVARVSPEDLGLEAPTGITRTERPGSPVLAQNAPNPFNAQTVIEAHVPGGSPMRLDIFNLHAQRVRSLTLPPGAHQVLWDGMDDSGRSVASGVYLYRLQEGKRTWAFRRMALIR